MFVANGPMRGGADSRRASLSCRELLQVRRRPRRASASQHARCHRAVVRSALLGEESTNAAAQLAQTVWHVYTSSLAHHPIATKSATTALLMLAADVLAQGIAARSGARSGQRFRCDWRRALRFSALGALFLAPLSHAWYIELDTIARQVFETCSIFPEECSSKLQDAVKQSAPVTFKVAADQLLFSPPLTALILAYSELFSSSASTASSNSSSDGSTIGGNSSNNNNNSNSNISSSSSSGGGADVSSASQRLQLCVLRIWSSVATQLPSVLRASWKLWPAAQVVTFTVIPLELQVLYVNFVSLGWSTYLSLSMSSAQADQSTTAS